MSPHAPVAARGGESDEEGGSGSSGSGSSSGSAEFNWNAAAAPSSSRRDSHSHHHSHQHHHLSQPALERLPSRVLEVEESEPDSAGTAGSAGAVVVAAAERASGEDQPAGAGQDPSLPTALFSATAAPATMSSVAAAAAASAVAATTAAATAAEASSKLAVEATTAATGADSDWEHVAPASALPALPPAASSGAAGPSHSTSSFDAPQWWLEEERLSSLLEGESVRFHFNCLRLRSGGGGNGGAGGGGGSGGGLGEEVRSILLLCTRALFLIDGYEIDAQGTISALAASEGDMMDSGGGGGSDQFAMSSSSSSFGGEDGALQPQQAIDHSAQRIAYSSISELHKRRFLLREAGLEVFLHSGATQFLVCHISQRDAVYTALLSSCPQVKSFQVSLGKHLALAASALSGGGAPLVTVAGVGVGGSGPSNSWLSSSVPQSKQHSPEMQSMLRSMLHPLTKLWQKGFLSNFSYLLILNAFSGRTGSDLSQYPVMPWILADYSSTGEELDLSRTSSFRDLAKPMGALDDARARSFKQRYRDSEGVSIGPPVPVGAATSSSSSSSSSSGSASSTGNKRKEEEQQALAARKFHFGSHYSSAAAVLFYLLRVSPFTETLITLQSGRFDRSDRLFFSVKQAWRSASKLSTSDVKELIPEFFYLSEMMRNGSHLRLGSRQAEHAAPVSDVLLPRWAHGSAREFVRVHRRALESEYVSAHLHEWIDLIWGYKQQGPAAVSSLNCFYYLTYAGQVDVDLIEDPIVRRATIEQQRSFGQTPLQLFAKAHPPRLLMPEVGPLFVRAQQLRPVASMHFAHAIGSIWADPFGPPMLHASAAGTAAGVGSGATGGAAAVHQLLGMLSPSFPDRIFVLRPGHTLLPHETPALSSPALGVSLGGGGGDCIGGGGGHEGGNVHAATTLHRRLGKSRFGGGGGASGGGANGKAHFVAYGFSDGSLRTGEIQGVPVALPGINAAGATGGASASSGHHSGSTSTSSGAGASTHLSALSKHSRVYLSLHDGAVVRTAAFPETDMSLMVTGGADGCVHVWKRRGVLLAEGALGASSLHPAGSASSSAAVASSAATGGLGLGVVASGSSSSSSSSSSASSSSTLNEKDSAAEWLLAAPPLRGHRGAITCLAVSKAWGLIVSGSGDGTVILWDLHRLTPVRQLRHWHWGGGAGGAGGGSGSRISHVAINHRSGLLAVASQHPSLLTLCDLNGALLAQVPTADSAVPVSGSGGAWLRLPHLEPVTALHMVDAVGFHMPHSMALFLTGHANGTVRVWNLVYGQKSHTDGTAPAAATTSAGTANSAPTAAFQRTRSHSSRGSHGNAASETYETEAPLHPPEEGEALVAEAAAAAATEADTAAVETRERSDSTSSMEATAAGSSVTPTRVDEGAASAAWEDAETAAATAAKDPASSPSASDNGEGGSSATAASSDSSPDSDDWSNESAAAGRCWRLVCVSELRGHSAPVTALFVPADRASVWSGDAQGHVLCWAVPLDSGVGPGDNRVPCTCPQSAQHFKVLGSGQAAQAAHAIAAAGVRQCAQCEQWLCAFCRLDHVRTAHKHGSSAKPAAP